MSPPSLSTSVLFAMWPLIVVFLVERVGVTFRTTANFTGQMVAAVISERCGN